MCFTATIYYKNEFVCEVFGLSTDGTSCLECEDENAPEIFVLNTPNPSMNHSSFDYTT